MNYLDASEELNALAAGSDLCPPELLADLRERASAWNNLWPIVTRVDEARLWPAGSDDRGGHDAQLADLDRVALSKVRPALLANAAPSVLGAARSAVVQVTGQLQGRRAILALMLVKHDQDKPRTAKDAPR